MLETGDTHIKARGAVMYQACELESNKWLAGNAADRPSFGATISRGLSGARRYQVFALPNGLLFLDLKMRGGAIGGGAPGAVVAGAVLGGAVGAVIGGMLSASAAEASDVETGFARLSEEQLFELAAARKRSFVAKNDEIVSLAITAPGSLRRMFADNTLAGWITLRDKVLGTVRMEIRGQSAMSVAVDALPRRYGQRVRVNVQLDAGSMRFVPCRG
jgi:hypothetical protein